MLKFDLNLLWTVINLIVFFVLMKVFLFKPIKKTLDARKELIAKQFKDAEDANNAALSAAQSAEDNRNTALHTLEKEQETTEKQNALDRAAAAVTASDAETLQAELDALLAVQQAGGDQVSQS